MAWDFLQSRVLSAKGVPGAVNGYGVDPVVSTEITFTLSRSMGSALYNSHLWWLQALQYSRAGAA